jgi:hypothetical protein
MAGALPITCGSCRRDVGANVIHQLGTARGTVTWLQCPNCEDGSVKTLNGAVYPSAPAGRSVGHLPTDVQQAWQEARTAHAVAAYTASEMMCRKILMHIAVDVVRAPIGKTFAEYVDVLESSHQFAPALKPVVDQVRDRGNAANHELPASSEDDSLRTLSIVEHLLTGIYELPALGGTPTPAP